MFFNIPRDWRAAIIVTAPFTISSETRDRCLRKPENSGLGLWTCMAFRTPSEEIIEKGWVVAQEKKAAFIKLDTRGDGVEGWNVKNLSA